MKQIINVKHLGVTEAVLDFVNSNKSILGKAKRLLVTTEVVYQNGQYVAETVAVKSDRSPIPSEVYTRELDDGDWKRIFSLRTLSKARRNEKKTVQTAYEELKEFEVTNNAPRSIGCYQMGWINAALKGTAYRAVRMEHYAGSKVSIARLY